MPAQAPREARVLPRPQIPDQKRRGRRSHLAAPPRRALHQTAGALLRVSSLLETNASTDSD
jgi:hypothetical protein